MLLTPLVSDYEQGFFPWHTLWFGRILRIQRENFAECPQLAPMLLFPRILFIREYYFAECPQLAPIGTYYALVCRRILLVRENYFCRMSTVGTHAGNPLGFRRILLVREYYFAECPQLAPMLLLGLAWWQLGSIWSGNNISSYWHNFTFFVNHFLSGQVITYPLIGKTSSDIFRCKSFRHHLSHHH